MIGRTTDPAAPMAKIALLVLIAIVPAAPGPLAEVEPLTLRVQDVIGTPGGMVAVVLRTYASRPIGQGQVCLVAEPTDIVNPAGVGAMASFEGAVVLSELGDAATQVTFEVGGDPQSIMLQFDSPSATVNNADGPLAALYFRLSADAVPGETYEVAVDTSNTLLYDENGRSIAIRPRAGELRVREAAAPYELAVDGGEARPGTKVTVGIGTREPFPIARGRIAVTYDPAIAATRPTVRMDPRHGIAGFTADTHMPGLVIVDFTSPGSTLNTLPGDLIELSFRVSESMLDGTSAALTLDPALTYLEDAAGGLLPVAFEGAELLFVGHPSRGGAPQADVERPGIDSRRLDISQ